MKIKVFFTANAVHKLENIADYIYEKTQSKQLTRKYLKKLRLFISSTLYLYIDALQRKLTLKMEY